MQLSIDIVAKFAQVQDALTKIQRDGEKAAKQITHAFESIGKIATGAFLGHEIKAFISEVTDATVKLEKSQALLANTLKATGFAAGLTTKQLEELNEQLSKRTGFDPEQFRNAEVALLRFGSVSDDVFKRALALSADLAAHTGGDVAAAAETIARAMQDPLGGMMKQLRGIVGQLTFSEKQLAQAFTDAGDAAGLQNIALEKLKSIQGSAEAQNKGVTNSINEMKIAWDDLLQALGKSPAFQGAAHVISEAEKLIADAVRDMSHGFADSQRAIDLAAGDDVGPEIDEEKLKATAGLRAQVIREAAETADRLKEQQRRTSAALTKAGLEAESAAIKQNADIANDVLKTSYDRGLIAMEDYYHARLAIAQAGNQRELADIDAAIKAQQDKLRFSVANRAKIDAEVARLQKERDAALAKNDPQLAAAREVQAKALKAQTAAGPDQEAAVRAEIVKLQAQRERAVQTGNAIPIKAEAEVTAEAQRLVDVQTEVTAQLLEQNGLLEKAATLRAGIANRARDADFAKGKFDNRDLFSLQNIESAQRKTAQFQHDVQLDREQLANVQRDIQSQEQAGAITTQEALRRQDEAIRLALPGLEAMADRMAAVAITPDQIQSVANFRSELKALGAQADQVGAQTRAVLEDSFTQPFTDLIEGTKNASDAFSAFALNVTRAIEQIAVKNLAQALFGNVTGPLVTDAGGTSLFGQILGKAAGAAVGYFSGAGTGATTTPEQAGITPEQWRNYYGYNNFANGGIMTPLGPLQLKRYAYGGIASTPQVALFGEGRKPEAYVPLPDGRTIPVSMKGAVPAGGNVTVTNHFVVNTPDAASFRRSEKQITTAYAMAAHRALGRR